MAADTYVALTFVALTEDLPEAVLPSKYIYLAQFEGRSKVGVSSHPFKRLRGLSASFGISLLQAYVAGPISNSERVERKILSLLRDHRIGVSEWLDLPFTQILSCAQDVLVDSECLSIKQAQSLNDDGRSLMHSMYAERIWTPDHVDVMFQSYGSVASMIGNSDDQALDRANDLTKRDTGIDLVDKRGFYYARHLLKQAKEEHERAYQACAKAVQAMIDEGLITVNVDAVNALKAAMGKTENAA